MGGELLGDPLSQLVGVGDIKKPTLCYTEVLYKCLPYYLALGMTTEEFWNCDPIMYRVYREKHKIELEIENQRLWLEGMYNYQSFALVSPALNAFKPKSPRPYPNKPFDLNLEEKKEEKEDTSMFSTVSKWADRINRKMGRNNGTTSR